MSEEQKVEIKKFDISPSVAILIAGVLVAGAIMYVNLYPSEPIVATGKPLVEVNVPPPNAQDHIRGSFSAPIVLIEYSDFQCPFCSMIHPTLKRIVDESNGEIAWVYRHLPLESIHPEALPSAIASECVAKQVGNEGFWKFADAMFADQSKMNAAEYIGLAGQFGANVPQFSSCAASGEFNELIAAQALDAQKNGGTGTPFTVVVKGDIQVPISGALPYAQIMAVINSVRDRQ
jgi:protein-disulfide isomerase